MAAEEAGRLATLAWGEAMMSRSLEDAVEDAARGPAALRLREVLERPHL